MRLHIIARGKIGRSPEADLVDRYLKRLTWPHKITELPDRGGTLPAAERNSRTVLLD
ncbi:MAG: 23S rRNA (pseudouridine(1915)-N(3))-methyltransferase RlmH, partial [Sphingomonadales bacterium]